MGMKAGQEVWTELVKYLCEDFLRLFAEINWIELGFEEGKDLSMIERVV